MKKITKTTLGVIGGLCLTTNVYANDVLYGEDIPKGKENEYEFIEEESIKNAYKDLTEQEANELKVSLEADGYTKVTLRSYKVKTGETTSKYEKEFAKYEDAIDAIKEFEKNGVKVDNIKFTNNTKKSSSIVSGVYTDLEQLEKDLKSLKDNYPENYTESINENEKDPENDATLETRKGITLNGETSYNSIEAAQNALNAFLNDSNNETKEFYFVGKVTGLKGDGTYTSSTINEKFNKKSDADDYLLKLETDGYIIIDSLFTYDEEEVTKFLDEYFDSRDKAQNAQAQFEKDYKIITPAKIDEIVDTTNNNPFEEIFDKKSDAENYLLDKIDDYKKVYGAEVNGNIIDEIITGEEFEIDPMTFNDEKTAEEAKRNLINNYDAVITSNIKKIEAGTVYGQTVYTEDLKTYKIGETSYVMINHGNEFFVWTINELSASEQEVFKSTYAKIATDTKFTANNVKKAKFINGYNKTFKTHNGKEFKFVESGSGANIIMSSGAESRVLCGNYTPVNEWVLTATVRNDIKKYKVAGTVITKTFKYHLTGAGKKTVKLNSGTLTGNKKIENKGYFIDLEKKQKSYTVEAYGELTEELESVILNADLTEDNYEELYAVDLLKKKYEFILGEGDGEDPQFDEENPQTGDKITWYVTLSGLSTLGLATSTAYMRKKKEEKILL